MSADTTRMGTIEGAPAPNTVPVEVCILAYEENSEILDRLYEESCVTLEEYYRIDPHFGDNPVILEVAITAVMIRLLRENGATEYLELQHEVISKLCPQSEDDDAAIKLLFSYVIENTFGRKVIRRFTLPTTSAGPSWAQIEALRSDEGIMTWG